MVKKSRSGGERDNKYYLGRLEAEAPAIHADLMAGKVASPAEAFRMAGLKRPRTRLQELKNSWSKASAVEQREFLRWLRSTIPARAPSSVPPSSSASISPRASSSPSRSVPASAGVVLSEDFKRDIVKTMGVRRITSGRLLRELGFETWDGSLGMALARGTAVRLEVFKALEKWLADNVD